MDYMVQSSSSSWEYTLSGMFASKCLFAVLVQCYHPSRNRSSFSSKISSCWSPLAFSLAKCLLRNLSLVPFLAPSVCLSASHSSTFDHIAQPQKTGFESDQRWARLLRQHHIRAVTSSKWLRLSEFHFLVLKLGIIIIPTSNVCREDEE